MSTRATMGEQFLEWTAADDSPIADLTWDQVQRLKKALNSFAQENNWEKVGCSPFVSAAQSSNCSTT